MHINDFREDDGSPVALQPNERLFVDATGKGWRARDLSDGARVFYPLIRVTSLDSAKALKRRETLILWLAFGFTVLSFALALYFTKVPHG